MNLLLHPKTARAVKDQLVEPSHAVLIHAPTGLGKKSLARHIASSLVKTSDLDHYAYFTCIKPEKSSISIDSIRLLNTQMSLRTIGTNSIRRVVLIEDANLMTIEAQNALLKLLEEPPLDTVIVLTASDKNALLPTLLSRVRTITISPLDKQTLLDYFTKNNHKTTEINKAYNLSEGHIGLMSSILSSSADHPIVRGIETAKEVLSLPVFERLLLIEDLSKDKDQILPLLEGLKRISRFMLQQNSSNENNKLALSWHKRLTIVLKAEHRLAKNAQPKLLLSDLFINL